MLAMDFRSSVGTPKTIYLAVDWHHHESPLVGRSAVGCLIEECETPFAVNIRRKFESVNRDEKPVNRAWGLSGETENSGERVPPRAQESATTLRDRKWKTESFGNIGRNWG
jgi:hypothetical protein